MKELQGYILALLATMLWGSSFIAARYLLAGTPQTDPLFMVFCRFGIAAAVIFLISILYFLFYNLFFIYKFPHIFLMFKSCFNNFI